MTVIQKNKQKVCPEFDYGELNCFVDAYTANSEVCAQSCKNGNDKGPMCLCWVKGKSVSADTCWQGTVALPNCKRYCLTWLGFSLNVAFLVMQPIIDSVMSQDSEIKNVMSTYIANFYVNES